MPPREGGHFTPKSTASRPASTTQQMVRHPRTMLMKWNASQMMKLTHKTLNPTFRPFSHRISSPNTSPSMQTQWLILKWRTQGSILRGKEEKLVPVLKFSLGSYLLGLSSFGSESIAARGCLFCSKDGAFSLFPRVFCSALSITN